MPVCTLSLRYLKGLAPKLWKKMENINFSKGHYAKGRDRCKMNMRVTVSVQSGDASLSLSHTHTHSLTHSLTLSI